MQGRQTGFRAFFNFLGRLVGAWFVLGGVVFIIYGIKGGAVYLVPGSVLAVLGILLILAKPYRPSPPGSASPGPGDTP